MTQLEQKIIDAAEAYYTTGQSIMTDKEFDDLVEELRKSTPNSMILNTPGWGYNINKEYGRKVNHKYGLIGSLSKCHDIEDIPKNIKNGKTTASLKLDGLSVVLYYEDGKFQQAVTRGNGTTGIDITLKILHIIPGYLTQISDNFTGAIRGEIVMSYDMYERYKIDHPEAKHPRNVTAGLINSKEIANELNYLDVIVYSIVGVEGELKKAFTNYDNIYNYLFDNNFSIVPNTDIELKNSFIRDMQDLRIKWYGKYPADGIVISNITTHHDDETNELTYNSIAYKYETESLTSKVKGLEWNLSKNGNLVPRVNINPIDIDGTTINWVTGIHAQYIIENGIDKGAVVAVTKANEIIPKITEVIVPSGVEIPTHCPVCGEQLVWDGVNLKCDNKDCGNKKQKDFLVWVKTLAPVEGLQDALIMKTIDDVLGGDYSIDTFMYTLVEPYSIIKDFPQDNSHTGRFNQMCYKLIESKWDLATALQALNIPRITDKNAARIAQYPEQVLRLLKYDTDPIDFSDLFGNANFKSIIDHFSNFKNLELILDRVNFNQVETSTELKGTVVITGKLSVPRKQFEEKLKQNGWKLASSISKNVNYLITDDPNSSSSKNKKADELGITKIAEKDFIQNIL